MISITRRIASAIGQAGRITRRRLRFSLATLLIAVTLLAIWLADWANSARSQQKAVRTLRMLNATVTYDFERTNKGQLPGPDWLREWLGLDYFATVVEVEWMYFVDLAPTIEPLSHLPGLERLILYGPDVTDDSIEYLAGLRKLKWLSITDSPLTDKGLAKLKWATRLESLALQMTDVHGEALGVLQCMNLRELWFRRNAAQDNAIGYLERFPQLEMLNLRMTQVTESSLDSIARIPNLKELWLPPGVSEVREQRIRQQLPTVKILSGQGDRPEPSWSDLHTRDR